MNMNGRSFLGRPLAAIVALLLLTPAVVSASMIVILCTPARYGACRAERRRVREQAGRQEWDAEYEPVTSRRVQR